MPERWPAWLIGLLFGVLIALMFVIVPSLGIASAALLGVALVGWRSLALLSGACIGASGGFLALLIRADLACGAFNAGPNQACLGPDLTPWLAGAAIVAGMGMLAGLAALYRNRSR